MGSYLNCNRTCLQSLITPSSSSSHVLPPSFHPLSPSSPPPSIAPSLTTLRPLHPDSLTIALSDTYSTLSNHPSKVWLLHSTHSLFKRGWSPYLGCCVFRGSQRSDRRERSAGLVSTFNLLSMDKESHWQTTSHTRGPLKVCILEDESKMQSRGRESL